MSRRQHRRSREFIAADLEVLPMMNLFIVLIPLLLLSAVFVEVAVIDMAMPSDSQAAEQPAGLDLTVRIQRNAYVVEGRGIARESIARTGDGAADMALSEALVRIARAHPGNRQVKIISQPTTLYDEIIGVMDVARSAGLPNTALMGADEAS